MDHQGTELIRKVKNLLSQLFNNEEMQIVIAGLKGAGKTTIMEKINPSGVIGTRYDGPLKGPGTAQFNNIKFTIWDVGVHVENQPVWRCDAAGLVFVVDSNDRDRVVEAKDELHRILNAHEFREAVLLVFANKKDLPNPMVAAEITENLSLHSLEQRHWYIRYACAISEEGLYEGLDWLVHSISNKISRSPDLEGFEDWEPVHTEPYVDPDWKFVGSKLRRKVKNLLSRLSANEEMQIVIAGLQGAGKTTIMEKINPSEVIVTRYDGPGTAQFNNIKFTIWDVGVHVENKPVWRCDAAGLIFVVDSDDRDRVVEAKDELHRILNANEFREAVLLVFANKKDLPNPMVAAEITENSSLQSVKQRHLYIRYACAISEEGLYEGLDWLVHSISNMRSRSHLERFEDWEFV